MILYISSVQSSKINFTFTSHICTCIHHSANVLQKSPLPTALHYEWKVESTDMIGSSFQSGNKEIIKYECHIFLPFSKNIQVHKRTLKIQKNNLLSFFSQRQIRKFSFHFKLPIDFCKKKIIPQRCYRYYFIKKIKKLSFQNL